MLSGIKLSQEQDSSQPLIESYCCVFKPAGLKGKGKKSRLSLSDKALIYYKHKGFKI